MSDAHDLRPHAEMWRSFCRLLGYSVAGIAVILIIIVAIV